MKEFKYTYIRHANMGFSGYDVMGVGTHDESSVLAGQDRVVFLDCYETLEEAKKAYPDADLTHSVFEPRNIYDHLPDSSDLY